jgi:hypothetical protein
LDVIGATSEG